MSEIGIEPRPEVPFSSHYAVPRNFHGVIEIAVVE
jgi:hypothetical protein